MLWQMLSMTDWYLMQFLQCPWIASYSASHYCDVLMGNKASRITRLPIVSSTIYSSSDQRKHQSSASLAFVWRIHWWPVNSPHKSSVTWKMFPFDDVIMRSRLPHHLCHISLCPSDIIGQHKSRSTLAQLMACCLSQCWLNIRKVLWH